MRAKGLSDAAIAAFKRNFDQLVAGVTGMVPEADITAVAELPDLLSMPQAEAHAVKVGGGFSPAASAAELKKDTKLTWQQQAKSSVAYSIKHGAWRMMHPPPM